MIQNFLNFREQHIKVKKTIKKSIKVDDVRKQSSFDTQTSDHDEQEINVKILPGRFSNRLGKLLVDPDFQSYRINEIHRENKFLVFDYQKHNASNNLYENEKQIYQEKSQISSITQYDSQMKFACECKISKIINDEQIITHKIVNAKWLYLLGLSSDMLEDYVLRTKVLPTLHFEKDFYMTSYSDTAQEILLNNFGGEQFKAKMTLKQFIIETEGQVMQLEYRTYDVDFKWLSLKKVQQNEKFYILNREKRCCYRLIEDL